MGKKIMVMFMLVFVCQVGFSQTSIDQLFNKFSKQTNMNKVKIGKFAMNLVDLFEDTMGVNGIEVLDFSECTDDVKANFSEAIRGLKDASFETMVNANEDGQRTKVMIRIEEDVIRELIVLTSGSEAAFVRIKGKIRKSDIEKLTNEHR